MNLETIKQYKERLRFYYVWCFSKIYFWISDRCANHVENQVSKYYENVPEDVRRRLAWKKKLEKL